MWFVIWTSTAREDRCLKLLNERFSDLFDRAFVPKRTISRKYGQEWRMIRSALFPGYLMVDTDSERIKELSTRLKIFNDFNVVLSTDGDFLPLTETESEFAERIYAKDGIFDTSVGIIEGDRITVTGGPLMGMEGSITKIDRHKRIAILELDMFGKKTRTSVGLEIVEKRAIGDGPH